MSYTITYKCEWCGKEHTDGDNEIKGHRGHNLDFKLGDLCYPCFKRVSRSLKTQRNLVTGETAMTSFAVFIALFVVGTITFICGVVVGSL